jgi:hypothetical protein
MEFLGIMPDVGHQDCTASDSKFLTNSLNESGSNAFEFICRACKRDTCKKVNWTNRRALTRKTVGKDSDRSLSRKQISFLIPAKGVQSGGSVLEAET